ncbi:hypothetical protein GCM10009566_54710 [Streptomyces murinus]
MGGYEMRKSLMAFLLVLCVGATGILGWYVESAGPGRPAPVSKQESDSGAVCC